MRQHLEIVAWLNLGMGALGFLAALLVFAVMGGAALLSGDAQAGAMVAVVATFIAGMVALLAAPAALAGWGLLRRKPWARTLGLLIGFLNLFAFPVGTLVGGYTIWVLMQDETRALLGERVP